MTVKLQKQDIPDQDAVWINAMLGPCIFTALVTRDDQGKVQEVRAGHFSTNFHNDEIDPFLRRDDVTGRTNIWIAGLAQKDDHSKLEKTTEKLVSRIQASGLPVTLAWESEERPVLTDSRDQQIVSDIGFGLLTGKDGDQMVGRYVSLGVTRSQALMLSVLFHRGTGEAQPVLVSLFTCDLGLLSQQCVNSGTK